MKNNAGEQAGTAEKQLKQTKPEGKKTKEEHG